MFEYQLWLKDFLKGQSLVDHRPFLDMTPLIKKLSRERGLSPIDFHPFFFRIVKTALLWEDKILIGDWALNNTVLRESEICLISFLLVIDELFLYERTDNIWLRINDALAGLTRLVIQLASSKGITVSEILAASKQVLESVSDETGGEVFQRIR